MKKYLFFVVVMLLLSMAFALTGVGQAQEKPAAPVVKIGGIMVPNVYVDFDADYSDIR